MLLKGYLAMSDDVYLQTVDRLEPEIHMIDAGAFYASAAISLKRIADALEKHGEPYLYEIYYTVKPDRAWFITKEDYDQNENYRFGILSMTPLYK